MSNPKRSRRWLAFAFAIVAGALLATSLKLPLWQMRLEAPQYRDEEALNVSVHPNALRGDLREISVLNQYIGVHVPPTLPQFKWLPAALLAAAVLGILSGFLNGSVRRYALTIVVAGLLAALGTAALQAKSQIYKIGHERDQHTKLVGVKDFTPPFLGTSKIAQFTVSSKLGAGAWLIGGALLFQVAAALSSVRDRTSVNPGGHEPFEHGPTHSVPSPAS